MIDNIAAEKIGIRSCVILVENTRVLCIHCKYGDDEYYLFPGGGVEPGETLVECAKREFEEETGLKIDITKLVYVNDWIKDKAINERVVNIFFLGKIVGGKIIQGEKDGGKVKDIEWVDLDRLSEIDFRPAYLAKRLKEDFENGFPSIPYFN
ncbi:MAG: NUDIX hydrolase [Nanoarchaeota archaeon]|nr:NUDIX hydrolase [Nanoarchaeota archaeon]